MATQGGRVRRKTHAQPLVAVSERETAPRDRAAWGWAARLSTVLPAQSRAILYKDLRAFPRDLGTMQQLIFPLAMAVFWIFEALAGSASPGLSWFLHGLGPAGAGIAIDWIIARQLGSSGVSREGKSFWLLQVAPLSPWRLLLGKLVVTYAPFPIVGGLVAGLLSIVYRQTLLPFLGSFVLVVLIGLGISSIALGLGAAFPRLDWENPRQQISPRASFSSLILAVVYLGLAIGALRGLPALGRSAPHLAVALAVTGWLLFVALTAATVAGALSFGMAGLNRALLGEGSP
jgi:ABC-2 type transport system permease protein